MKSIAFDTSLEYLFKTYFRRLVYFSYQIVSDKEMAEDVVQEVFMKYWHQKEEIDAGVSNVSGYLYSAVKNASLNAVRHQKVINKFKNQVEIPEIDEATIEHAMIQAEAIAQLYSAIESLPVGCQEISRMGFLEEKKNQEIAKELGISVTTVKSQKQRALQLLRMRISPDLFLFLLVTLLNKS